MIELVHHVAGKHIKTRSQALQDFWDYMRAHNGNRRTDPEKFVRIKQVRQRNAGSFDVFYEVPARVLSKSNPASAEEVST